MISSIKKISELINKNQRRGLILLTFLLFIGMFFEIIGLGIIIPLLEAILEPQKVRSSLNNFLASDLIEKITDRELIYYLLIFVTAIYFIKSSFLILLSSFQNKLIVNLRIYLSTNLFSKYLNQDYESFISKHSSFYTKNIQVEISNIINLCSALITIIIEFFLILSVIITLIFIEPLGALLISSFFLLFAFIYSISTKSILKSWSMKMQEIQVNIQKKIIDGFGGFKEFKVLNKNKYVVELFSNTLYDKAKIESKYLTLQQTPRHLLELVSILGLIGFIFFLLLNDVNIADIITIIGVFVAATFRMIPSLNRLVGAIQHLKHDKISLDLIYNEFNRVNKFENQQIESLKRIKFIDEIQIISMNLSYGQKKIFKDFNLSIKKGSKIGIMGPSGSGKSSFVNVLLGFISPNSGSILVDNYNIEKRMNSWRNSIGYVPQDIFLTDDTVENNIALGVSNQEIDRQRVLECIKLAELDSYIESSPHGIKTLIGERGVKMSGGQKQRIGIARALYNNPNILIFDEATSALDDKTEELVMNTIYNLDKNITSILISHRESTLNRCDKIIRI
ncbi:MAG: ABC transporter ATP-binding protein/permease [Flavobacteriaceae bacterium]|nr:ABC transporter ATP-binding protein/permease [Flavobacteriaceae bacterium]MCI5087803.1 ABC transporter ATP-binding protein/permease [Flavobacteriaceae bacterium]